MAVNLLAPLGERPSVSVPRGYTLVHAVAPDERLCAWIDWCFAPSWWSSEVHAGSAWYALAADGSIAGFAGYGSRERAAHWLRPYDGRDDVGIFGPYGVAEEHRRTGIGRALLGAALGSLAEAVSSALIPAVGPSELIALYERRAGARVVDTFEYRLPRARTVVLASGNGTNAQAVIDAIAAGRIALDLAAIVTNDEHARVRARAARNGIADAAVVWHRGAESRSTYDARVIDAVARFEPELVLLLGWMHLLPAAFLERFPHTINVHPAFLPFDPARDDVTMPDGSQIPAFRGARAPEATVAAGTRWTGASVHRVTPATDRGAILVRVPVALAPEATLADVRALVQPIEHAAVVAAIRRWGFERQA